MVRIKITYYKLLMPERRMKIDPGRDWHRRGGPCHASRRMHCGSACLRDAAAATCVLVSLPPPPTRSPAAMTPQMTKSRYTHPPPITKDTAARPAPSVVLYVANCGSAVGLTHGNVAVAFGAFGKVEVPSTHDAITRPAQPCCLPPHLSAPALSGLSQAHLDSHQCDTPALTASPRDGARHARHAPDVISAVSGSSRETPMILLNQGLNFLYLSFFLCICNISVQNIFTHS